MIITLEFTDTRPDNTQLNPVLISGSSSAAYSNQVFLTWYDGNTIRGVYEIKYEPSGGTFREALLMDELLAAGHGKHFYLFSLSTNKTVLLLEVDGYFGHLYYHEDTFYVADASALHCVDKNGEIRWRSAGLGIDGVIVHEFSDDILTGSGEFDPPGGWIPFSIDRATGTRLSL